MREVGSYQAATADLRERQLEMHENFHLWVWSITISLALAPVAAQTHPSVVPNGNPGETKQTHAVAVPENPPKSRFAFSNVGTPVPVEHGVVVPGDANFPCRSVSISSEDSWV